MDLDAKHLCTAFLKVNSQLVHSALEAEALKTHAAPRAKDMGRNIAAKNKVASKIHQHC